MLYADKSYTLTHDIWTARTNARFACFFVKMKYSDSHTLHGSAYQFIVTEVTR
jgi:hypothetical protein